MNTLTATPSVSTQSAHSRMMLPCESGRSSGSSPASPRPLRRRRPCIFSPAGRFPWPAVESHEWRRAFLGGGRMLRSIQITGDEILIDGVVVATIDTSIPPTVREWLEDSVACMKDPDDLSEKREFWKACMTAWRTV